MDLALGESNWAFALLAAALYFLIRGIWDLRQKQITWGLVGIACGLAILSASIKTHAVKFDFPPVQSSH